MGKVGRNDPCPCGSGSKYKKCCLPKDREKGYVKGSSPGFEDRIERIPDIAEVDAQTGAPRSLSPTPRLPDALRERVNAVDRLLDEKGFPAGWVEREDSLHEAQVVFEQACRSRWEAEADDEPELVAASERLLEADDETRFTAQYHEGYRERREALAEPLKTLQEAKEAGIPHLCVRLHEDSWAGVLAVEALAEMPSGPLRDRAIVEALFSPGDWLNDTAVTASEKMSPEASWRSFEEVARQAAKDEVELQHFFWTALFEDDPASLAAPLRPTNRFGDALVLLFDLGHLAALGDGLFHVLDPSLDEARSVRAFLDDEGVQDAIEHIRSNEPTRIQTQPSGKQAAV